MTSLAYTILRWRCAYKRHQLTKTVLGKGVTITSCECGLVVFVDGTI